MRWRATLAGVGIAGLLAGCGGADRPAPQAASPASATTGAAPSGPAGTAGTAGTAGIVPERLDLDAVGDGITEHKLDLFLPTNQGSGPFPVVIWVHGGGWKGGDKSDVGRAEEIQMVQTKQLLLDHGYAVAAPNYHLLPNTRFPQPMQDVSAAVRYLRAHAGEFGLDAQRFALMGDSAGGHLAAMTAMTPDKPDLQGSLGDTSVDAKVRAFVGYYGLYDLTQRTEDQKNVCGGGKPGAESSHGRLVGADPDSPAGEPAARAASPVTYVSPSAPAVLLFAGREDCTAPYPQAERFHAALTQAGVPGELKIIDKAHGDAQFFTDPAIHDQLLRFLDRHVKN